MKAGTVRGADQREFVKAFNGICNWNNNWERWNDMVKLFAVSIANSVDRNNYEEREKDYNRIRGRYKPQEFEGFVTCFGLLIESLERNPFQDFLGQMYMELEMGSQAHGQWDVRKEKTVYYSHAIEILDNFEAGIYTEDDVMKAIDKILSMETINAVRKDLLLKALRFARQRIDWDDYWNNAKPIRAESTDSEYDKTLSRMGSNRRR